MSVRRAGMVLWLCVVGVAACNEDALTSSPLRDGGASIDGEAAGDSDEPSSGGDACGTLGDSASCTARPGCSWLHVELGYQGFQSRGSSSLGLPGSPGRRERASPFAAPTAE